MTTTHPLIGQRVHISSGFYTGVAIVLEYDPKEFMYEARGPFYCHLLDLCAHKGERQDEMCDDPADECMGEICRGWYAIEAEQEPVA